MTKVRQALAGVLVGMLGLTGLAACGADDPESREESTGPATPTVTVADAWVRASDPGSDMTAAFALLTNAGDGEVTVVAAESTAAPLTELHEVVTVDGEMVMRPREGGFVIPAGDTYTLQPGGDHIMIMGMTGPLEPGEEVTVTLILADDTRVEFTAPVRAAAAGDEEYQPDGHGGSV